MSSSVKLSVMAGSTQTHSFKAVCKMTDNSSINPPMADISIAVDGVEKLMNLSPVKASGPNGIRPRVLKELAKVVAPILTIIYQRSVETAEVPKTGEKQ